MGLQWSDRHETNPRSPHVCGALLALVSAMNQSTLNNHRGHLAIGRVFNSLKADSTEAESGPVEIMYDLRCTYLSSVDFQSSPGVDHIY